MSRARAALFVAAAGLLLVAIVLPSGWYDAIPHQPGLPPPPVSGVLLFRATLLVEAVLLAWWAVAAHDYRRLPAPPAGPRHGDGWADLSRRDARWLLAVATALALLLRLHRMGTDLWLDEITPILDYGPLPVAQVIGSYLRSNNHLLNTLLIKVMIAVFGEREWAVRLPAILFGTATVPVLYWCARTALSRWGSLGVALLLACSYHHIFFSQNARGYTAYLFFALAATRLLIDGLREDRLRSWVLYAGAICLGFASLLNTAFVLAAHVLIGVAALALARRRGEPAAPRARRLAAVFAAAGFLSFQLYSVALPEVYVVITHVYKSSGTGFAPFSTEFLQEMIRGVSAGFGTGMLVAAIPFLLVATAGFLALVQRRWELAFALALPGALTALFLLVRGLTFSPRFFLLWLPLAMVTAVTALEAVAGRVARARSPSGRWASAPWASVPPARLAFAGALALTLLSLVSLRRYYAVPKQPYRDVIAYVERTRRPDDVVVVVYTAEKGIRYYGERSGVPLASRYRFVRSLAVLDSVLAATGSGRTLLVTTFPRALRIQLPEVHARIAGRWAVDREFAGSVGDGSISVWRELPRGPAGTPERPVSAVALPAPGSR